MREATIDVLPKAHPLLCRRVSAEAGTSRSNSAMQTPPVHAGLLRDGSRRRVGVLNPYYGLEKVSYTLPLRDFSFVTVKALPIHRYLDKRGTFWAQTPFVADRSVELVHTFNSLPVNSRRFVVSFEMELPRYLGRCSSAQMNIGWRILRSNRCKAVLALSEAARKFLEARLLRSGNTDLGAKLGVFRGAVLSDGVTGAFDGPTDDARPLQVIFVGADARRKGLVPLLGALQKLRDGGLEVGLTVVSSIEDHTYVFPDDFHPAAELRARIQALSWVRYHPHLPNARVKELMRRSDLFVVPTLDESLGWAIIEAGMAGIPVISTNIFAIPELVQDGEGGRLVPLERNEDLRWSGIYLGADPKREAAAQALPTLEAKLVELLNDANANRALLKRWGRASRDRLSKMYDPGMAAATLEQIYRRALS